MKKILLSALALSLSFASYAQWSTASGTIYPTTLSDKLGIGTNSATHSLTLGSTATGLTLYNTADQTTNFERVRHYWNSGVYTIGSENAGTGSLRNINLLSGASNFGVGAITATASAFEARRDNTALQVLFAVASSSLQGNTYTQNGIAVLPTINQSGVAGYRGLWVSPYQSATGSGSKLLIDVGTNTAANGSGAHSSKFSVTNTGVGYFAGNVGIGTTSPDNALTVVGNIKSSNLSSSGNNVSLGPGAGNVSMTGLANTLLGNSAGASITSGAFNTVIGAGAAGITTGSSNIVIGTVNVSSSNRVPGQALTSGSNNLLVGSGAGSYLYTGEANIAIGNGAMTSGNGSFNTVIGLNSGYSSTTGSYNVYLGTNTGFGNTTGSGNTFIGYESGKSNTTGSGLTFLGNNAGASSTDGLTNATAIGYNAQVTTSNTLILGNGANVGIGTSSPDEKLTVNGKIHAKEVKVDVSIPAPDYVFDADYKLPDLDALKAYISANHHLPEISPAREIEREGIELSVMNMKLLKKVEELTLYLIQKDEQLKAQEKTNNLHQQQIDELKKQLNNLTKSISSK